MDQKTAKEIFDYRDGKLFWRNDRGSNAKAGQRAGGQRITGYRAVFLCGKRYQEHRLIYLWHHGHMPKQIDHINMDKSDNRIENLRPADSSQNQANTKSRSNSSGYRGVRLVPETGRWAARIYKDYKEIRIGTFDTPEEASAAYQERAKELFGEFAAADLCGVGDQ